MFVFSLIWPNTYINKAIMRGGPNRGPLKVHMKGPPDVRHILRLLHHHRGLRHDEDHRSAAAEAYAPDRGEREGDLEGAKGVPRKGV